jgi:2-succinyl-5-enolpyruvyl-6-hydroxy-3-cyclohexene-1-carboxylate synthase
VSIDFRNTNTIWASVLVETFYQLGLTTAIACPGSRSTPLTIAFATHPQIEAIPVLDERSAAFFALGIAKRTGTPVVLVCTSGTAGANFYPAVIEARESRVPLIILTADRPPELRDCHAGQTIDQTRLYGNYPTWYAELAIPALDLSLLSYLRQTLVYAWERSRDPIPGAVHLNCPLRNPLPPIPDPAAEAFSAQFPADFFEGIAALGDNRQFLPAERSNLWQQWQPFDRGIIVAGVAQPQHPEAYCRAIACLSQSLEWPVLAEGLSPLRNYAALNPYLITTYDAIVRQPQLAAELAPNAIVQIGDFPTSKELRSWLTAAHPQSWAIDPTYHNLDPLHGRMVHVRMSVEAIAAGIPPLSPPEPSAYLQRWCELEAQAIAALDRTMAELSAIVEPKVAWLLSQTLPPGTPLFIANSMPVRDVEWFWRSGNSGIEPFFNRGANGIDGTLSTALGIAHRHRPSVLLTGDLALLHDTNGFLLRSHFVGHLTIILINNNGGGIFQMLPVSQFDPPFEEFFATPQQVDWPQLCQTYGVEYEAIGTWEALQQRLKLLPDRGIRLLEIKTDRRSDTQWRKANLPLFAGLGLRTTT